MYVVLFDGVCNLCNASINWIIDHDKKQVFRFASLQSDYGKATVERFKVSGNYMDTVLLQEGDKLYMRSEAVLRIAKHIGGVYSLLYVFIIIPAFIRDFFYNLIAKNRYRWFGKQDNCRIPTPELKARFLENV
ncbi:MAG: thiol-disulfide oxidoreductase DCC family protein [Chitinophagales bacterium]|nr:thiol-disulfide oxidoreductase DCC family protein [Chitinophagales bacterium]